MARPPRVRRRALNPCFRFLRRTFGWYVRFMRKSKGVSKCAERLRVGGILVKGQTRPDYGKREVFPHLAKFSLSEDGTSRLLFWAFPLNQNQTMSRHLSISSHIVEHSGTPILPLLSGGTRLHILAPRRRLFIH